MFKKIIEEEQTVNWTFGDVQESVYPLEYLDSIEPTTGKVKKVVDYLCQTPFPDKPWLRLGHCGLRWEVGPSGTLTYTLGTACPIKMGHLWSQHVLFPYFLSHKLFRLFSQLFMYICYFFCVLICFLIRPTPFERDLGKRQLLCTAKWDWHALRGKDLVSFLDIFENAPNFWPTTFWASYLSWVPPCILSRHGCIFGMLAGRCTFLDCQVFRPRQSFSSPVVLCLLALFWDCSVWTRRRISSGSWLYS